MPTATASRMLLNDGRSLAIQTAVERLRGYLAADWQPEVRFWSAVLFLLNHRHGSSHP